MVEPTNGTVTAAADRTAGKLKLPRRRTLSEIDGFLDGFASQMTQQLVDITKRLGDLQALTAEQRIRELALTAVDHRMAEYAKTHADAVAALNALVEAGAISRAQLNAAVAKGRAKKMQDKTE